MALLIIMIVIWVALSGEITLENVGVGLVLGVILLFAGGRAMEVRYFRRLSSNPVRRFWIFIRFVIFFLTELIKASWLVFIAALFPARVRPGVIAVPLDLESSAEITLLANLITLTPGTLSLDVSTDRKVIYVHAMYVDDAETFREEIKNGFEKRIMELMRS